MTIRGRQAEDPRSSVTTRELVFNAKLRTVQRSVRALVDELAANERLPLEKIEALQRSRRASIAAFAQANTAFYAERFRDAGLSVGDLADPEAWASLPITTKTHLRENNQQIRSSEAIGRNTREVRTSGSTGQPNITLVDARFASIALSWRMQKWWGIDPWEDAARIDRGVRGLKESLAGGARWWPTRRLYLQLWQLDEASVRQFARTCLSVRPVMLEGQVAALFEVAEMAAAGTITFPPFRAVGVTASQLMPSVRLRLEEVYGAPVYDQYRCAEVPFLAGECRAQSGMHIFSDYRYLEVVDDSGRPVPDGEEGDVVVTDLSNRVFPIIRYKLGDRARIRTAPCTCGITMPLMESPLGRANEVLRLPDRKTLVSGLNNAFWDRPDAARQYQVHQRADYSIVLRVIPGEATDYREVTDQVAEMIRTRCKNQVPVSIEYVNRIDAVNGKFSYVICDV